MKYTEEEIVMVEIPEKELKRREAELDGLQRKYKTVLDFIAALSFYPICESRQSLSIYSARANICECGDAPLIVKSLYEKGKWLAQCQTCNCRTVEADNPVQAVKYWNAKNFTEDSKLMKTKLEPIGVSTEGLIELCDAITKRSVEDLKFHTLTNTLDDPEADNARKWIRNKKVIDKIESGEWIEQEENKEEDEEIGYPIMGA